MLCISITYKRTPDKIRQKFSFTKGEQKEFLNALISDGIIAGGVIISTCNRNELYATVNKTNERDSIGFLNISSGIVLRKLEERMAEYKGLSKEEIRSNCYFYQGKRAVLHLYRVVCGLDSMVLGEDEILHQAKEAYLLSKDIGAVCGELNILFQGAFNCAKVSKSRTDIAKTPVSIGTLTANYVEQYIKDNNRKKSVLVIGASGQIGSIVAKDLIAKNISVIGTTRKHKSEYDVLHLAGLEWIGFDKRYDYLNKVSVVVSATRSPHYTLTRGEYEAAQLPDATNLLVDLAVPFDIDRDIESIEGVKLIGLDHFKQIAKRNNDLKCVEGKKIELIVSEGVEDVLKRLFIRDFQNNIPTKKEQVMKMVYYLKDTLDSESFLKILKKIYIQEVRG